MLQLLATLLLLAAVLVLMARFRRLPPPERRKLLLRSTLGALAVLLLMMVVTGRVHWIGAIVGAILPLFKGAMLLGMQLLPFWQSRKRQREQQDPPQTPNPQTHNVQESMAILGLKGDIHRGEITRDMVIDAHRRLIQKLHPDRGGNDYLAAKLNDAKEVLLKALP